MKITLSFKKMATGRFHIYWADRHLAVFEHLPLYGSGDISSLQEKPNTLLFITGLFDTFASVPCVAKVASSLARRSANRWSVMEIQLTSFGVGFGTGDLIRDAEEVAQGVAWLRSRSKVDSSKVVLIGHSTGSQDVLHYLYHGLAARPAIDGAILQAPVSDREGFSMILSPESDHDERSIREVYFECIDLAKQYQGHVDGPSLPRRYTKKLGFMHAFLSPERFLSLASPDSPRQPSLDDLFSSDLPEKILNGTFGTVGTKNRLKVPVNCSKPSLLVLISGEDEYMPNTIDKESLLARWTTALENGGTSLAPSSGVVAGAKHNGESVDGVPTDLIDRCLAYLELVEGDSS